METMTFAGFRPRFTYEGRVINHSSAYEQCQGYAEVLVANPKGQKNLLLMGPYGVGKTRLAVAILNACREANISCLCTTVPHLFKTLYAANFEEKEGILQQASTTRVLMLDDLDKLHIKASTNDEKSGTYQKEKLFEILDSRYVAKLPTIVTTNAEEDMSRWLGEAGISRFFSKVTVLKMQGPDYRLLG
jgi:DNA replication protein DnaC